MKLIQDGKKDPAINEQDWKFIKTSLRQCIATKFITESEKEEILNYLETTEEADLTVPGLMAESQSVTSFVLSLLQAANVQRDFKRQWQRASNINPDHLIDMLVLMQRWVKNNPERDNYRGDMPS